MLQHSQFLKCVKDYVSEHPEVAPYVTAFVAEGVEASRKEILSRAADMEVALSFALNPRLKDRNKVILSKLVEWRHKACLNWDSENLKSKTSKEK